MAPDFETYVGADVMVRLRRVLHKKLEVIGRFTQELPCNWKLYMENVRDTYHASLLHTFFTTFKISRAEPGRRRDGQPERRGPRLHHASGADRT